MIAKATTPPMTPPAIAPVFDDFLESGVGVGGIGEMTEEEVVGTLVLVGL